MVQTVKSLVIVAGDAKIVFEKPLVLRRIYVKIVSVLPRSETYKSHISLDDPSFHSYFIITEGRPDFEAKGDGIFQGNIWLRNPSSISIYYTATEILI